MLDYEHQPTKRVSVPFTWQSIDLELSRARKKDTPTGTKYATWNKLLEHAGTRMALQETLLEASLLMPPLYVGRTNNLRQRYLQHVQDSEPTKNDFHSRFAEHAADLSLKISVNDLIFFCIRTPKELRAYFGRSDNSQSNTLVEQILMLLCRPPFSIR